jgi:hypothetical protein
MFKWIKESLFGDRSSEEYHPEHLVVKLPNISEPVYAILKAWKEDPKRFIFSEEHNFESIYVNVNRPNQSLVQSEFYDVVSGETFEFGVHIQHTAVKDYSSLLFKPKFGDHGLYVCLGYILKSTPSWMTDAEVEYLENNILPYYKKRCERYVELIEYRKDRQLNQQNKFAQLTKQRERDRLMELYK